MTVRIIYSINNKNYIGKNNKLIWHIPEDLNRFKNLTEESVVIMGRKTYESLPVTVKPLPGRTNIVITSKHIPDVKTYTTLTKAIEDYKHEDIWLIGGKRIIEEGYNIAKELVVTHVYNDSVGDVKLIDMPDHFALVKETLTNKSISGYVYNYQLYTNLYYLMDFTISLKEILSIVEYICKHIDTIELAHLITLVTTIKSITIGRVVDSDSIKIDPHVITDVDLKIQTRCLLDEILICLERLYNLKTSKKKLPTSKRDSEESVRFVAIEVKNFLDYINLNVE